MAGARVAAGAPAGLPPLSRGACSVPSCRHAARRRAVILPVYTCREGWHVPAPDLSSAALAGMPNARSQFLPAQDRARRTQALRGVYAQASYKTNMMAQRIEPYAESCEPTVSAAVHVRTSE